MQGDRGAMYVHVQRCKPKKIKILLGLKNKLAKAEHCQFNHKNNIYVVNNLHMYVAMTGKRTTNWAKSATH